MSPSISTYNSPLVVVPRSTEDPPDRKTAPESLLRYAAHKLPASQVLLPPFKYTHRNPGHPASKFLFLPRPERRLSRFKILFLSGKANGVADLLSRLPDGPDDEASATDFVGDVPAYIVQTRSAKKTEAAKPRDTESRKEYNPSQRVDEEPITPQNNPPPTLEVSDVEQAFKTLSEVNAEHDAGMQLEIREHEEAPQEIKLPTAKIITDKNQQKELIEKFHNHRLAGHLVTVRSIIRIREHFYWKGMNVVKRTIEQGAYNLRAVKTTGKRVKRYWESAADWMRSTFGTLNENDLAELNQNAENVKNQQQELLSQTEKSKAFLLESFNNSRSMASTVNKIAATAEERLNLAADAIEKRDQDSEMLATLADAARHFFDASVGCIDLLTSKRVTGKTLNLTKLHEIFGKIKQNLAPGAKIAVDSLLELSIQKRATIRVINNVLVTQIRVPIVSEAVWALYHIKRGLMVEGNKIFTLHLEDQLVAVSPDNFTARINSSVLPKRRSSLWTN